VFCPKCGAANDEEDPVCHECGALLEALHDKLARTLVVNKWSVRGAL
jgi:uncharacterized membrane protein YvbJ